MKTTNLQTLCTLGLFLSVSQYAVAEGREYVFTYDYNGATHDIFGVQRNVQLDAAMLLQDPSLIGSEVIGISVEIPTKEGCSCDPVASAWLTKKLQVDGEYNLPDIQQVNGEIRNYGTEESPELRLDLTFPEPYTVTEEGVYVGYSVTVTSCNVPGSGWTAKYPIVTVCDVVKPQSFMFHCTKGSSTLPQKYPEWTDLGETMQQALAMKVLMKGQTLECGAELVPQHTLYVAADSEGAVYCDLNNLGTTPINSIDYSYTVSDSNGIIESVSKELKLDESVIGQLGAYTTLDIPFISPDQTGNYQVELRVERINGVTNEYLGSSKFNMVVVPFLPVNRPLVEDYTGMWCGNCPGVYVTIHQMMDKYGEDFLSLSYHTEDNLQGVATDKMPSSSYGLPKVYIGNRSTPVKNDNIESIWRRQQRELAPADIEVQLKWADEARTTLRAESSIKFVYDEEDADYMISYALVEDDMSDPSWKQTNYYTNEHYEGPYWDLFCGQPRSVEGLIYDDVVLYYPDTKGIPQSLPSSIVGSKEYKHDVTLSLDEAICRNKNMRNYGESILKDSNQLRVVAVLLDGKTGNVVNAASTGYSKDAPLYIDPTGGVGTVSSDSSIISTTYYSIDGTCLNSIPEKGTFISISLMSDGTVKTSKLIR